MEVVEVGAKNRPIRFSTLRSFPFLLENVECVLSSSFLLFPRRLCLFRALPRSHLLLRRGPGKV